MDWLKLLNAFWVGGLICAAAQVLIDKTKLTPARIMVSYVVAGVVLTALGWYELLVKFAGAGATVPIVGFGYSLAKGVMKSVTEQGWYGILLGGLTATAAGITAAMLFGYLAALLSKPRIKK